MKKVIRAIVAVLETYSYFDSLLVFNVVGIFDKIKYKKNEKIRENNRRIRRIRQEKELGC